MCSYIILEEHSSYLLSLTVSNKMKDGWKPQGGPFYAASRYMQAMVKEADHG